MNQYEWYKKIKIIANTVLSTEANDTSENKVNDAYEFFDKIKGEGFHISQGVGTNNTEIQPLNQYEFYRRIKLDDEGRIKVKFK